MTKPSRRIRLINHTADIGIEVLGSSLKELFVSAADGMTGLMVECLGAAAPQRHSSKDIFLKADIREELLVKWLEEILYFIETKRLVPVSFNIKSIDNNSLSAQIEVVSFDPKIHHPKYQIKAVTYHDLTIKEDGGIFKTRVIFDI